MAKQTTKSEVTESHDSITGATATIHAEDPMLKLAELERIHAQMMAENEAKIAEIERQLEEALADAKAMTDHHNDRVLQVASLQERLERSTVELTSMVPGKQLVDEGDHEVVIIRRKKVARPTGRIIPRANIRLSVPDSGNRSTLRSEGARLNEEASEHAHQVMLTPEPDGREPRAYTVPEAVARDLVSKGYAVDELR